MPQAETGLDDLIVQAERAYVYAYPLLLSHRLMCDANRLFVAPGPGDTLRIRGWLDLGRVPQVLSLDQTFGRYYVLWLRDAWNTVYASVGARATGTRARAFAVLGPTRVGERLRPGLDAISAPGRLTRVSGCIEAAGASGAEPAARMRLCELSRWTGIDSGVAPATGEAGDVDLPSGAAAVERMDARSFFSEALRLSVDDPPEPDDRVALAQLRALLSPGGSEAALEEGARRGREAVRRAAAPAEGGRVRGWRIGYDTGRYGTDYLRRAAVALAGVEPAPDELSAMVDIDADGRPLSGRDRYVLRFPAEATPPVNGFWTLITAAASTGDRRGLALDGDGSLPIHIQHAAPDAPRRCNWLPAPAERFNVELRLYWPCEPALDGHWTPPALTRVGPLRRPGRRPRRDRSARP